MQAAIVGLDVLSSDAECSKVQTLVGPVSRCLYCGVLTRCLELLVSQCWILNGEVCNGCGALLPLTPPA